MIRQRMPPWLLVGFLGVATAAAQTPTATIDEAYAGDCVVTIQLRDVPLGSVVEVTLESALLQTGTREEDVITLELQTALQLGARLGVAINNVPQAARRTVAELAEGRAPRGECVEYGEEAALDDSAFNASLYVGTIIDTFAPDQVADYENPEAGTIQKMRRVTGVAFSGRLAAAQGGFPSLWLYGETIYGVKTADIDCALPEGERPSICDANNVGTQSRFILERASSMEAFVSPIVYLFGIGQDTTSPASVYVTGRSGFMALEKAPQVYTKFHLGGGIELDGGTFAGSYLEAGWGNNELIAGAEWNRLKLDAMLAFPFNPWNVVEGLFKAPDTTRFFVQMVVDNDLRGQAPDIVQTLFGVTFDVRNIAGWY